MDFLNLSNLLSESSKEKKLIHQESDTKAEDTQNPLDIWTVEEVEEQVESRLLPEYTLSYKQDVSTEDIFLGMTGKTPSFSNSDAIIIQISLPKVTLKDIHLTVEADYFDLRCPT